MAGGLERISALLEHVPETSPDAMLLARADGTVAFAKSQAESPLGYSRDELEGSSIDTKKQAARSEEPKAHPQMSNRTLIAAAFRPGRLAKLFVQYNHKSIRSVWRHRTIPAG
jgi:PAS domain-containing protein